MAPGKWSRVAVTVLLAAATACNLDFYQYAGNEGVDGGGGVDAVVPPPSDGGQVRPCPIEIPAAGVVAHYRFDGDREAVQGGLPPVAEHAGGLRFEPGPAGSCGQSLSSGPGGYGVIPDHSTWRTLETGTIDFWLYLSELDPRGVLTRDAIGDTDGDFRIALERHGTSNVQHLLTLRIQNPGGDVFLCGPAMERGRWYHVGVAFGGGANTAFYVDGSRVMRNMIQIDMVDCGTEGVAGLAGNSNPWVVLADGSWSPPGTADDVSTSLRARIDELRISQVRVEFDGIGP